MLTFSWRRNCSQAGFNNSLLGLSVEGQIEFRDMWPSAERKRALSAVICNTEHKKTFKGFGLHFKLCFLQEAHWFLYSKASSKPAIKRETWTTQGFCGESRAELPKNLELLKTSAWNELLKNQSSNGKAGSKSKHPWSPAAPQPMTCLGGDHLSQALSYWKQDLSLCSALQLQIQTGHSPSAALSHAHTLCVLQGLSWIRTKKQLRPQ